MFKKYVTKPEHVQAIKITMKNIEDVAKVVGGRVGVDEESGVILEYPTLAKETFAVLLGDYLTQDSEGRFNAVDATEFENEFEMLSEPKYVLYDHTDL